MFRDDRRRRIIQDNLVELTERLSPDELLPHLSCLSKITKQKIECRFRQYGQQAASIMLLDDLPRKDKWWEELLAALRHPSVGMEDLAEFLQRKDEGVYHPARGSTPKHQSKPPKMKKPPIDWSTPFGDLMPFSVVLILSSLDVDSKWKELAAYLGYTLEAVNRFETYTKDGKYLETLCRDLKTRPNVNLGQMVDFLKKMERTDLLEKLRDIRELRHLDWSSKPRSTGIPAAACDSLDSSKTDSTHLDNTAYGCEAMPLHKQTINQYSVEGLEVNEDLTNSLDIEESVNTVPSVPRDVSIGRLKEGGYITECSLIKIGTAVGLAAVFAAFLYRS